MRELLTMQNVTARYQSPDGELTAAENISPDCFPGGI